MTKRFLISILSMVGLVGVLILAPTSLPRRRVRALLLQRPSGPGTSMVFGPLWRAAGHHCESAAGRRSFAH